MRIDQYLKHHLSNATRTKLQNAIETESVKVNDKPVKSSYKIKPFDVITICPLHPPRETEIFPEDIPLNIIYEDDEVLVLLTNPLVWWFILLTGTGQAQS